MTAKFDNLTNKNCIAQNIKQILIFKLTFLTAKRQTLNAAKQRKCQILYCQKNNLKTVIDKTLFPLTFL